MSWKKYAYWLQCCWALLIASPSKAQEADFLFETLPPRSDLGQTTINAMLQDQQGYLWLATWWGLWRYDAYSFRQFGPESGLNSSKITCIFEETDGTLWVGARNTGLYRFDRGREFFEPAAQFFQSENVLTAQNITSVFRDREGRYWVGAEEGLSMFDPAQKRLLNIPLRSITPPPSENIYLYSICQTADGSIWVSGSHGLYRSPNVPKGSTEPPVFQQVVLHPAGASAREVEFHNFVYTGQPTREQPNALWLGTKHGLKHLNLSGEGLGADGKPAPGTIRYFEHREGDPMSLSHNFVTSVCEGDFPVKNALWVATFNGLNLLSTPQLRSGKSPAPVFTQNGVPGYFRRFFAKDEGTGGLQANNVRSLLFDRSGILWVGTNRGLNKLNPHFSDFILHPLRRSRHTADESISFLSQTTDNVWVSSFGGGIFRVPLREGHPAWAEARHYVLSPNLQSPVTDFISAVLPDGLGNLWCVTQGAGAFRFREKDAPPGGGAIARAEQFAKGSGPLDLGDGYLMSALASRGGRMWLGCWDAGLNLYDPTQRRVLKFNSTSDGRADFHLFPVVALAETQENGQVFLWAGTRGGGLFQLFFDEKAQTLNLVRRFHRTGGGDERMGGDFISSLVSDEQQNFWIATESGIFMRRRGQTAFEQLPLKNFPQPPHYEAIVPSGNGRFWVSTQKGIGYFTAFGAGSSQPSVFYDSRNGLRERAFTSNAFLRLSSGELLFGGSSGVTSFHPDLMLADTNVPSPVITGLRLFNRPVLPGIPTEGGFVLGKSLSVLPQLALSHRDNVVSFEFSGLHFSCPEQNRFAYKLDGFDPDWTYTDASQRLAHYTNLPSGEYRFLVKAANSDGIWNPQPAQLAVRVLPPWWRTPWAYTLYFVAFLGLLWLVRRITLLRANYENAIHIERLEKQKLAEVNQMKLTFFTNVSHELKTPLTLIISPLEEIIRARTAGSNALHSTLSMMHRNAVRLLTMINQLLDIRKAEAGLMKLEVGEGNVVQFVNEVCLSFRELAQQRQIQFSFQPEQPIVMAWFDPDQLEKVFFNLLSNALKFTPPGGEVQVSMGEMPEKNQFFVRFADNGKGISEDKLPLIFDRFFRAEEHDEAGGTGIGLSLVKNIVEQHHGTVEAESLLGLGSVFTIWLPLGDAVFSEKEKKRPTVHGEEVEHYAPAIFPEMPGNEAPISKTPEPPEAEKPHILLVEDNADIREYLQKSLSPTYVVSEADNGHDGLQKTLDNLPDLVLCDISMPGMDGLELTRQLKTRVETSHIPVVLLTARTSLIFKIDGLEAGADDYVTKPFHLKLLQLRIHNLIESRRRLREQYAQSLSRISMVPEPSGLSNLDDLFLQNALAAIEQHLEEPDFSVDDLAKKLLLNRKQVYRKIKALTDQTPNELIRAVRLQRAAQLLRTHRYTVAEVTYMVGFQDLKYFRERFREFFGVNPSEIDMG